MMVAMKKMFLVLAVSHSSLLAYLASVQVDARDSQNSVVYLANNVATAGVNNSGGFVMNNGKSFGVNNGGADEEPQVEETKDSLLSKAIRQYRCRQFGNAANDLGAALPSEFNNPLLHYYYANCMVHLRHKESAIREYRIAYALQPTGTIGEYCKLCLDRFGIDAEGKKSLQPKLSPSKSGSKNSAPDVPEPPSATELAALKANPKDGSENALAREKSVENLKDLMQQKKRPSGSPLPSAVGTNLYVRNYKETVIPPAKLAQQSSEMKKQSSQTALPGTTQQAPQLVPPGSKSSFPLKGFKLWWW